jgi:diaminopropionate ammonia-lyase
MAEMYVVNTALAAEPGQPRVNFTRAFHERLPDYSPTPLLDASELATELGVRRVWIKDESARLGLPSYELLGVAWAIYRVAMARLGRRPR